MKTTAVVLAAGQGTRMRSALPKVLFPLLGRPDLNQDIRIQSPLCYRCTTPQCEGAESASRAGVEAIVTHAAI